ncbi:hypothetical protein FS837_010398 [Tulasnella sp. UAMH 9824]|nr:hypothetical protein FS837_010398 [Tulasnella sp. UAMH 9824]
MTQVSVAKFNTLPPELCLPIARISLAESGYDIRDVVRISNINSRMRNIVVDTPDLWRKFTLSTSLPSHELGILCVQRSGSHDLDLRVSLFRPMAEEKEVLVSSSASSWQPQGSVVSRSTSGITLPLMSSTL